MTMPAAPGRDAVFAPLVVEGAVEQIVRRLGEAIGTGLLRPGERLPTELDLAALLSVAPMTLRQALSILRDAGYVETRRGRGGGSFVAVEVERPLAASGRVPSPRELRDLIDWRRAVGGEAAALAALRADGAARATVAAAATTTEVAAQGAFATYRLADASFHVSVAAASGSSRLLAAETAIQAELDEILAALPGTGSVSAVAASTVGHLPIIRALERRDGDAARVAMVAHVEATYDWVIGLHLGRLAPETSIC